jgi:hypothetical protein
MTMAYLFWYGYHVPNVRRRDLFYERLEEERIAKYGCKIPFVFSLLPYLAGIKRHGLMCSAT